MKVARQVLPLFCAAVLAAAGCSRTYPIASRFLKSEQVSAKDGATLVVTESESAELAGTSLVIPPGALAENTVVTLEVGVNPIAQGPDVPLSAVAAWGPPDLALAVPAQVTMKYALPAGETANAVRVQKVDGSGQRTVLESVGVAVSPDAKTVTFRVTSLSAYQVVAEHCDAEHHCPAGSTCQEGQCVAPTCGSTTCHVGQLCCSGVCATPPEGSDHCPSAECGPDRPCSTGFACMSGICRQRCGLEFPDVHCPEGTACIENVCWPHTTECSATHPCPDGHVCDQGTCRLRCGPDFPDVHCPEPQHCIENYICR